MRSPLGPQLVLVAASLAGAGVLLRVAGALPNFALSDDGYYYAQIAYQLGTTGRSTFDGVHATSGHHAAWTALLAAASRVLALATTDRSAHLFAYLAISSYLALWTAWRWFTTTVGRIAAVSFLLVGFSLTEMVLAAPVLLAILERAAERDDFGERIADAILVAILPLVRVDLVVVPLAVAACLVPRGRRRAAAVAAAAVLGAALQLGAMKLATGHFLSVSATLKLHPPTLSSSIAVVMANAAGSRANLVRLATVVVLAALPWLRRGSRPPAGTGLVAAGALSFLALHVPLIELRSWYWLPTELGLLLGAERATRGWRVASGAIGALAALHVARAPHVQLTYAEDRAQSVRFVRAVRDHVPPHAVVYQYDGSGFVAFFSGRTVIAGDGLVNDHAYARRLLTGRLAGYLEEEGVCWIVTNTPRGEPLVAVSGIVVRSADVELVHAERRRRFPWGELALHRLTAPRCRAAGR